jgi:hypothetical protein
LRPVDPVKLLFDRSKDLRVENPLRDNKMLSLNLLEPR